MLCGIVDCDFGDIGGAGGGTLEVSLVMLAVVMVLALLMLLTPSM